MSRNSRSHPRTLFAAALFLGVGSVFGTAVAPALGRQAPAAVQATQSTPFSSARAYEHVQRFSDTLGPRVLGTPVYDQAAEYAVEKLSSWGYEVSLQMFALSNVSDRGSRVAIAAYDGEPVTATTLQGSGGGEVEAPIVYVGLGRPEDLAAVDVRGAIALVQRGEIRFGEKVANAANAGAVGVVVFNNQPGQVQGSLGGTSAVPAAMISRADGERLVSRLQNGPVQLRLQVDADARQVVTSNVIARKPGTVGGRTVVVGAHLDSVPAAPGASDNASGSAVVLELARTMADQPYPHDIEFVLFGAEEIGLVGSARYVESLTPEARQSIVGMINLDMVGVGESWRFGGSDFLVNRALGYAAQNAMPGMELRGPLLSASDHASFLAAGVPAVFVHLVNDPNYHAPDDTARFVSPERLGEAGAVALDLLDLLATR